MLLYYYSTIILKATFQEVRHQPVLWMLETWLESSSYKDCEKNLCIQKIQSTWRLAKRQKPFSFKKSIVLNDKS